MLTQNNGTATDSGARWSKPKGVGRCAAVLGCLVLLLLGSEQLAAQKPATNVNGNLIPREMRRHSRRHHSISTVRQEASEVQRASSLHIGSRHRY